MNAGAAVYVAGRAESIEEGVGLATEAIDSGAARDALDRYLARTHTFG
jgi:anthranilate phosphoribosyltransferase